MKTSISFICLVKYSSQSSWNFFMDILIVLKCIHLSVSVSCVCVCVKVKRHLRVQHWISFSFRVRFPFFCSRLLSNSLASCFFWSFVTYFIGAIIWQTNLETIIQFVWVWLPHTAKNTKKKHTQKTQKCFNITFANNFKAKERMLFFFWKVLHVDKLTLFEIAKKKSGKIEDVGKVKTDVNFTIGVDANKTICNFC